MYQVRQAHLTHNGGMYLAGECAARQCRAESSVSLPCVACHAACVYGEQRRAAGHPCWRQAARRRAGALRGTLPPPSLHWLARGAEPRSAVQAHCWYRRHLRVGWLKARDRPSLCLLAALSAACSDCSQSYTRNTSPCTLGRRSTQAWFNCQEQSYIHGCPPLLSHTAVLYRSSVQAPPTVPLIHTKGAGAHKGGSHPEAV